MLLVRLNSPGKPATADSAFCFLLPSSTPILPAGWAWRLGGPRPNSIACQILTVISQELGVKSSGKRYECCLEEVFLPQDSGLSVYGCVYMCLYTCVCLVHYSFLKYVLSIVQIFCYEIQGVKPLTHNWWIICQNLKHQDLSLTSSTP